MMEAEFIIRLDRNEYREPEDEHIIWKWIIWTRERVINLKVLTIEEIDNLILEFLKTLEE